MVKIPEHEEDREEDRKEEEEAKESGLPSHETKDSQDREKAAKNPEAFGNEWGGA